MMVDDGKYEIFSVSGNFIGCFTVLGGKITKVTGDLPLKEGSMDLDKKIAIHKMAHSAYLTVKMHKL